MKCTSHGGLQQLHLRSDGRNSRPTFAAGSVGKVGADRYGSVRRSRRYRKSRRLIRLSHIVQRIPLKFNDLPISLTITSSQNAVKTVKRRKPRRRIALWWGTFVFWNGENLDFMRFSGIEKVHRNSIKITVDLWRRARGAVGQVVHEYRFMPLAGQVYHGVFPRPKNASPKRFLNGLSNPLHKK